MNTTYYVIRQLVAEPEIFACRLFHEFQDLSKFIATGREISTSNLVYYVTSSSASKNAKIKGVKIV